MTTTTQRYAVLSVTPYYGPRDEIELLDVLDDPEAAAVEAAAHNPDYDDSAGADRLAHNQSAATYAEVAPVIWRGDNPYDDWERLPGWVQDAAEGRLETGDGDPDGALATALDDSSLVLLAEDEHGDSYILVRRPGAAG